ncbi:MAG: hypothetical protein ACOVP1_01095 [Bacteroidia bacterium]
MSTNNELDVQITSKPSETDEVYFEISSADVPIGSGYGFVLTAECFDEPNLNDHLEFSVVMGGANPYKWYLRPDDPNKYDVDWQTFVTIKKGGKTGKAQKTYSRSAPNFPRKNSISVIVCSDKLIIETNAIQSKGQKLVLDTESTERNLVLRVVNDGTGTYPYEYKLIQDGVIHHLCVTIINEKGEYADQETSYLRESQKLN